MRLVALCSEGRTLWALAPFHFECGVKLAVSRWLDPKGLHNNLGAKVVLSTASKIVPELSKDIWWLMYFLRVASGAGMRGKRAAQTFRLLDSLLAAGLSQKTQLFPTPLQQEARALFGSQLEEEWACAERRLEATPTSDTSLKLCRFVKVCCCSSPVIAR